MELHEILYGESNQTLQPSVQKPKWNQKGSFVFLWGASDQLQDKYK